MNISFICIFQRFSDNSYAENLSNIVPLICHKSMSTNNLILEGGVNNC